MMRKTLATIASVAVMFGSVAGVALAATNDTQVINSGTGAVVNSSATENNAVVVNNNNDAKIVQTSSSVNISGQNTASNNISLPSGCGSCMAQGTGTTIVAGPATSTSNMTAVANSNQTAVMLPSTGSSSNNLGVVNTGAGLTVNASATTNNAAVVNNSNSAYLKQSSNSVNISGQNIADNNIGTTSIVTLGANSVHNMSADVNHNTTVIGIGGLGGGTGTTVGCCGTVCTASNCTDVTNTGTNALVNSSSTTNNAVVVNNNNRMWASQSVFATDISGQNDASFNIGGSGILAGPAGSISNMALSGNENATGVALGAGMPLGGNLLSVVNTGLNMTTNASANTNNASQTNNNNSLWGWQNDWAFSLSGQNSALSNIGGSGVFTVGAGSLSNFGLSGNANTTFVGNFMSLPLWLLSWWV